MRTSKREIGCVKALLLQLCLRKANGEIGVVARIRGFPGIAADLVLDDELDEGIGVDETDSDYIL
jgi:hypothetical protein